MICDLELFHATSPGSARRILCRCNNCGVESYARKQNIMRKGNYTFCQPCAASRTLNTLRTDDNLYTDEWRRSVSRGHDKRDPSTYNPNLGKDYGPANHRWNPDREFVERRKRASLEAISLLNRTLKATKTTKIAATAEMLGYTKLELCRHLEQQFLPGMSWENRRAWHIDHIKTVAQFVAEGISDMKVINALSNLRPLWAKDNLSRGRAVCWDNIARAV